MVQHVLIDQLKEKIKDTRVKAALFHTFEFDTEFFEHYLLPVFLPEIPFSDNKIHNAILWRQYQQYLPPITVYCDFYGKSEKSAPTLPYMVHTIARKPAFHPKTSFILTENDRLVVFTGSNNLTESGWCKNLEGFGVLDLKNGSYFPDILKQQLRQYVFRVAGMVYPPNQIYESATQAERMVISYLRKQKSTHETNIQFFQSLKRSFRQQLRRIRDAWPEETFDEVEILSPYFGDDHPLNSIREILQPGRIRMALPFANADEVSLSQAYYEKLKEQGVEWCHISLLQQEKAFRFNHSKVYRIKGRDRMITVMGSVNFTHAAFQSFNDQGFLGNVEAGLIYEESVQNWESLLQPHRGTVRFLGGHEPEDQRTNRLEVPDLTFAIDWQQRVIHYKINKRKEDQLNRYMLTDLDIKEGLPDYEGSLPIDGARVLQLLADNPLIRVQDRSTREVFYFYPLQEQIELRPLSSKLKITDRELLTLWEELDEQGELMSEGEKEFLEKIIDAKTNDEGELKDETGQYESTLNMMASHLSALIKLEKALFNSVETQKERERQTERIRYYLYTDNINTLLGYLKILKDMHGNGEILPAFYWLLLHVIRIHFYDREDLAKVFNGDWDSDGQLSRKNEAMQRLLNKRIDAVQSELEDHHLDRGYMEWVLEQLDQKEHLWS